MNAWHLHPVRCCYDSQWVSSINPKRPADSNHHTGTESRIIVLSRVLILCVLTFQVRAWRKCHGDNNHAGWYLHTLLGCVSAAPAPSVKFNHIWRAGRNALRERARLRTGAVYISLHTKWVRLSLLPSSSNTSGALTEWLFMREGPHLKLLPLQIEATCCTQLSIRP